MFKQKYDKPLIIEPSDKGNYLIYQWFNFPITFYKKGRNDTENVKSKGVIGVKYSKGGKKSLYFDKSMELM